MKVRKLAAKEKSSCDEVLRRFASLSIESSAQVSLFEELPVTRSQLAKIVYVAQLAFLSTLVSEGKVVLGKIKVRTTKTVRK